MRGVLLLVGAAGFMILGRVSLLSPADGADAGRLGGAVLGLMGLALCAGLVELWLRDRRSARSAADLASLWSGLRESGQRASDLQLAALDGAVVARIRARVERQPVGALVPSLTPYLAGLMVALGLIGGFLGVIDTLVGAEQALQSSGHWRTLRVNLQGPLMGLAEGFEVSAAGLCAALLLGVAGVAVRRGEDRLAAQADALAASAQAPMSSLGDQLVAMEALIRQADALPQAAQALEGVSHQLAELEASWLSATEKSTRETLGIVRDAVSEFRSDLKHGVEESARAAKEAAVPLLEDAVAQTTRAATSHLDQVLQKIGEDFAARREAEATHTRSLERHVEALARRADADREVREEGARAHQQVLEAGFAALEAAERERAAELAARWETLTRQLGDALGEHRQRDLEHDRLLADVIARLKETQAAAADLAGLQAEAGERAELEWQARSERMATQLSDLGADLQMQGERQIAALSDYLAQAEGRAVRLEAAAGERAERLLEAISEAHEGQLGATVQLGEQIGAQSRAQMVELGQHSEALREAAAQREAQAQARVRSLLEWMGEGHQAQLAATSGLGEQLAEQSRSQLAELGDHLEALRALAAEGEARGLARLESLLEQVGDAQTGQAQRMGEFEARLVEVADRHATAQAEALRDHAEALTDRLLASGETIHEAASLVKAGGAELSGLAELFGRAVDRQREAAEAWLANLGEVEGAVERAGRGAAADALRDQLDVAHQLHARQLDFQRELFEELRQLREGAGRGAAAALAGDEVADQHPHG